MFGFDFDVGKLIVFGIVALAVIPPKDLPRVMRTVGQAVGKMRRMAAEFQHQFMDAMKEADLESVKKELTSIQDAAKVDVSFDPTTAMREEATKAVQAADNVGTSTVALDAPAPTSEAASPPIPSANVIAPPTLQPPANTDAVHAAPEPARGAAE